MRRTLSASVLSTWILFGLPFASACSREPTSESTRSWDGELRAGVEVDGGGAPRAALSLTASDGTGLRMSSLTLRAAIEDPMALTELHMVFENPEERTIEGNFRFLLPSGASLSRFAMKTDSGWQEGEVVETQAARRAYEDFLHRKQDPALLEQAPGNEFTARVFPIRGRAKKEIIVTYSQTLERGAAYSFPLAGLPRLEQLGVQVFGGDAEPVVSEKRTGFVPGGDLIVRPSEFSRAGGVRAGQYMMARVVPKIDTTPAPLGSCVVLIDTSASRALGMREQIDLAVRLVASLPAGSHASVFAFDQTTDLIFDGDKAEFGPQQIERLVQRGALGASDLGAALDAVRAHVERNPGVAQRLVLIGDGVTTTGETDAAKLRGRVENLRRSSLLRFDAVALGGLRDEAGLSAIVRGGLAQDGLVLDAKIGFDELRKKLDRATRSRIPVKVEGATWTSPTQLDGIQPGDEVRIFAEVPIGTTPKVIIGDAAPFVPDLRAVDEPLLQRAWASTKIASLVASPPEGDAERGRREVIDLSREFRVMSPFTSMLVLETDEDYRRFDIDRKAKLDILTVTAGRIAVAHQSREPGAASSTEADAPSAPWGRDDSLAQREGGHGISREERRSAALRESAEFGMIGLLDTSAGGAEQPADPLSARGNMWGDSVGDAFGAGGLGLGGRGAGGGGRGEGIGLGSIGGGTGQGFGSGAARLRGNHASPGPRITMPTPSVSGQLPPEVVQRIVRQNFGRVRLCYEQATRSNPTLRGAVVVRFVIDRAGMVASVGDGGSTFPDRGAVSCVARAMNGLSFPSPESGIVTVVQRFLLGDGVTDPGPRVAESMPFKEVRPEGPYTGTFAEVMDDLGAKKVQRALEHAKGWQAREPGDVMALIALGEAHEAAGDRVQAARAYGSVLELFASRADSRRFAGERLERLGTPLGFELAASAFRGAVEQRPDHPASHRLLAYSLLRAGKPAEAFAALEAGEKRHYPEGRFLGVDRILGEDLVLLGLAWMKAEPERTAEIEERLRAASVDPQREREPSVRFVLVWETDANDVDFHIRDGRGGHAYYASKTLPSGGELYADVTTGYGPECFTVRGPKERRAYPYTLSAHYYSRGPMGYGMGKLQILEHDGKGGLTFEERPFVIMRDGAFVDLGVVKAS